MVSPLGSQSFWGPRRAPQHVVQIPMGAGIQKKFGEPVRAAHFVQCSPWKVSAPEDGPGHPAQPRRQETCPSAPVFPCLALLLKPVQTHYIFSTSGRGHFGLSGSFCTDAETEARRTEESSDGQSSLCQSSSVLPVGSCSVS